MSTQAQAFQHQTDAATSLKPVGFEMPGSIPGLPVLDPARPLLNHEQEIALGFRIKMLSLRLLGAMAADCGVVERLAHNILAAITSSDNAERSAQMINMNGRWIRIGTVPNHEFAAGIRDKVNNILACLADVRANASCNAETDLFNTCAIEALRSALCEILPYDFLLNQASSEFKARCEEMNKRCRNLVRFVASELRIKPRAAHRVVCWNWVSPTLYAACLHAGGYEASLFPAKARKAFREALIDHQKGLIELASNADVPVTQMLQSWDDFWLTNRDLDASVASFAAANVRMVETIARDYRFADDMSAVRSAGQFGLMRAIQRFAPDMGLRFSTFSTTWIRQSILRDLAKQDLIRLPEGSHSHLAAIRSLLRETPNASHETLSAATGLGLEDVANLVYFVNYRNAVSMDSAFTSESGEAEGIHDHVADENGDFVEDLIVEDTAAFVSDAIGKVLNDREKTVLLHRYGIGGAEQKTLVELSEQFSVSIERVRQIELKAIQKLRESDLADALADLW